MKVKIVYRVHIQGRDDPELDAIRNHRSWGAAWRDMSFGISFCHSVAKYWIETIFIPDKLRQELPR